MVELKDFKLKRINIPFDAVFNFMMDSASYYISHDSLKAVYEIDGLQTYHFTLDENRDEYARVHFDRILLLEREDRAVIFSMHIASISYRGKCIELYLSSQGGTGDEKAKLQWYNSKPYADVIGELTYDPCETKYKCATDMFLDTPMPWFNKKKLHGDVSRWFSFFVKQTVDYARDIVDTVYRKRYSNRFGKMYCAYQDKEFNVIEPTDVELIQYGDTWVPKSVYVGVRSFNLYAGHYSKEVFFRQYREYFLNCLSIYLAQAKSKTVLDIYNPSGLKIESYEKFALVEKRRNTKLNQVGTAEVNRAQAVLATAANNVEERTKKHILVNKFPDHEFGVSKPWEC